jgi:hypothetical protein
MLSTTSAKYDAAAPSSSPLAAIAIIVFAKRYPAW